jgi:hypothetical protein
MGRVNALNLMKWFKWPGSRKSRLPETPRLAGRRASASRGD